MSKKFYIINLLQCIANILLLLSCQLLTYTEKAPLRCFCRMSNDTCHSIALQYRKKHFCSCIYILHYYFMYVNYFYTVNSYIFYDIL